MPEVWVKWQDLLDQWGIPFFKLIEYVKEGLKVTDSITGKIVTDIGVSIRLVPYSLDEMKDSIRAVYPDIDDETITQKALKRLTPPPGVIDPRRYKPEVTFTDMQDHTLYDRTCPNDDEGREKFVNRYTSFVFDQAEVNEFAQNHGLSLIGEGRPKGLMQDTTSPLKHIEQSMTSFVFRRRDSGRWEIGHPDRPETFDHLIGFIYIAHLLELPGEKIDSTYLFRLAHPLPAEEYEILEQPIEKTDKPTVDAIVKGLAELEGDKEDLLARLSPANVDGSENKDELEDALESVEATIKQYKDYLSRTTFKGKPQRATSTEAQRKAIPKAITTSLEKIHKVLPEIRPYLNKEVIRTGGQCEYIPSSNHPINWELS
ncbi:MAG: hypothetical protein HQK57_02200 [Deltaproteobacteria bacterium]|nr:hypothetical protein [Deltaproteobacteria bacterium]